MYILSVRKAEADLQNHFFHVLIDTAFQLKGKQISLLGLRSRAEGAKSLFSKAGKLVKAKTFKVIVFLDRFLEILMNYKLPEKLGKKTNSCSGSTASYLTNYDCLVNTFMG